MMTPEKLATECAEIGLFFGINPHFLLSIAQLRSGLKDDTAGDQFGPFRLTQADWDKHDNDPEFAFDFQASDIKLWRATCDVCALMVYRGQNDLLAKLGNNPTAVELYLELWPATDASTLPAELKKALDATAALVGPAIASLEDPSESQGVLPDPAAPIEPKPSPQDPSDTSFGTGPFKIKAPRVMHRLINDFGFSKVQAAGVVGNLGHESGGFRIFHEIGQPFDKGGIGWAQWTGRPGRRQDFEVFCSTNHLDITSDEASYRFLKFEMQNTPEKKVVPLLLAAQTLEDATKIFVTVYERAGVVALASRIKFAKIALQAFDQ